MIHLIVTEPPFLIMFLKGWIHVLFVEIIALNCHEAKSLSYPPYPRYHG